MKTFNNNPPTAFADLCACDKYTAIQKMSVILDLSEVTMVQLIYNPKATAYNPDAHFQFFPLNNDVAVKDTRPEYMQMQTAAKQPTAEQLVKEGYIRPAPINTFQFVDFGISDVSAFFNEKSQPNY